MTAEKPKKKKKKHKGKGDTKAKDDKAKIVGKVKSDAPARGIETMFRTALRGHIDLSAIADNKANIMLSINAIIISIVLTGLIPEFYNSPHLVVPTIILLSACVLTVIFATISTIPKVTSGVFTPEQIENKTANLLFFGNFHKMSLDDFQAGINEVMKDKDFLYGSMTRDFYHLGLVLNRKYHYLRITYRIFMFGIVTSVIAFALSYLLNSANPA